MMQVIIWMIGILTISFMLYRQIRYQKYWSEVREHKSMPFYSKTSVKIYNYLKSES